MAGPRTTTTERNAGMITRTDIGEALAILTGYAADKTPRPAQLTIQAWEEYFAQHPAWTGNDLLDAVVLLNQRPRERLVQPADLGDIIRTERADHANRHALPPANNDSITLAEWETRHGPFPRHQIGKATPPPGHTTTINPLTVPCPHCGAPAGRHCTIPGTREPLTKTQAHPSRYQPPETTHPTPAAHRAHPEHP